VLDYEPLLEWRSLFTSCLELYLIGTAQIEGLHIVL